jgi:hypothetical protein
MAFIITIGWSWLGIVFQCSAMPKKQVIAVQTLSQELWEDAKSRGWTKECGLQTEKITDIVNATYSLIPEKLPFGWLS